MNAEYLGDSVYAKLENRVVKLYLNNGDSRGDYGVIFLEPEVFENLIQFVKRMGWLTDALRT